jgi:HPt (histidine-containing phosphotransfer) domain-containing protein
MVDLINIYLEQTPGLVKTMRAAVAQEDWPLLKAAAHKIKPSFRIVGEVGSGEQLAAEIEQQASESAPASLRLDPILTRLERLCDQIYNELQEELGLLGKMGFTRS